MFCFLFHFFLDSLKSVHGICKEKKGNMLAEKKKICFAKQLADKEDKNKTVYIGFVRRKRIMNTQVYIFFIIFLTQRWFSGHEVPVESIIRLDNIFSISHLNLQMVFVSHLPQATTWCPWAWLDASGVEEVSLDRKTLDSFQVKRDLLYANLQRGWQTWPSSAHNISVWSRQPAFKRFTSRTKRTKVRV